MRYVRMGSLLAVVAAVTMATTANVQPPADTVSQLTSLLPSLGGCEYVCDTCAINKHTISAAGILDPFAESAHEEWCQPSLCPAGHECGGGGVSWVAPFERIYYAAETTEIREFVEQNADRVILNEDRNAVQILGCNGQVLASYPFAVVEE